MWSTSKQRAKVDTLSRITFLEQWFSSVSFGSYMWFHAFKSDFFVLHKQICLVHASIRYGVVWDSFSLFHIEKYYMGMYCNAQDYWLIARKYSMACERAGAHEIGRSYFGSYATALNFTGLESTSIQSARWHNRTHLKSTQNFRFSNSQDCHPYHPTNFFLSSVTRIFERTNSASSFDV